MHLCDKIQNSLGYFQNRSLHARLVPPVSLGGFLSTPQGAGNTKKWVKCRQPTPIINNVWQENQQNSSLFRPLDLPPPSASTTPLQSAATSTRKSSCVCNTCRARRAHFGGEGWNVRKALRVPRQANRVHVQHVHNALFTPYRQHPNQRTSVAPNALQLPQPLHSSALAERGGWQAGVRHLQPPLTPGLLTPVPQNQPGVSRRGRHPAWAQSAGNRQTLWYRADSPVLAVSTPIAHPQLIQEALLRHMIIVSTPAND